MMSYPCNKYEQITPSYFLSVKCNMYLKLVLLTAKFPFQRYIVCWGKICRSQLIGGGASYVSLLFCKMVNLLDPVKSGIGTTRSALYAKIYVVAHDVLQLAVFRFTSNLRMHTVNWDTCKFSKKFYFHWTKHQKLCHSASFHSFMK